MPISTCSRRRWFVVAAILAIIETAVLPGGVESARADVGDPYPLANCVVQDMELDRRARVIDDDGREIRVCCKDCVEEFEDNFHTWIAVVDERIIQQQRGLYPLTKCVVDGEPLENALTIDVVFRNRLFRLCSPECQEKLEKDPKTYFAKLNQAVIEKQKPDYPLDKCIVSGKPLTDKAVDHVVANQLIRLANPAQIERFNRTPGKYLVELRKAGKKKGE